VNVLPLIYPFNHSFRLAIEALHPAYYDVLVEHILPRQRQRQRGGAMGPAPAFQIAKMVAKKDRDQGEGYEGEGDVRPHANLLHVLTLRGRDEESSVLCYCFSVVDDYMV
jgi:hypothetical protein